MTQWTDPVDDDDLVTPEVITFHPITGLIVSYEVWGEIVQVPDTTAPDCGCPS